MPHQSCASLAANTWVSLGYPISFAGYALGDIEDRQLRGCSFSNHCGVEWTVVGKLLSMLGLLANSHTKYMDSRLHCLCFPAFGREYMRFRCESAIQLSTCRRCFSSCCFALAVDGVKQSYIANSMLFLHLFLSFSTLFLLLIVPFLELFHTYTAQWRSSQLKAWVLIGNVSLHVFWCQCLRFNMESILA